MARRGPGLYFPHPSSASKEGLLAIGGDLSPQRLLLAYHFGIFPWYSEGYDILWWCPDPRCVLFPDRIKISKSMRSVLRRQPFQITVDHCFEDVISSCQKISRNGQEGTWITDKMLKAYCYLHHLGVAHSVEIWQESTLVGGLYGVSLGKVFFGESMFSTVSNASKFGLILLTQRLALLGYEVIDCQQDTPHLRSLGAELIPRNLFLQMLQVNRMRPVEAGPWSGWSLSPTI